MKGPIETLNLTTEEFNHFLRSGYVYKSCGSRYTSAEPYIEAGIVLLKEVAGKKRVCPVTVDNGRCQDEKGFRMDYGLILYATPVPQVARPIDAALVAEAEASIERRESAEKEVARCREALVLAERALRAAKLDERISHQNAYIAVHP